MFRYDPDASGTISGEKFMNKLGISFSNGITENGRLSPIAESGNYMLYLLFLGCHENVSSL
jgi:hypothetical protein